MCKSEKKDAVAAVLWPHDAGTLIFVRPNFESSEKTNAILTKKGPSNPDDGRRTTFELILSEIKPC